MEARIGTAALTRRASEPASTLAPPAGGGAAPASVWIVSPAFDLLFFANLGWPLLLIPGLASGGRAGPLEFFQIYFLTTPHRWITLLLVLIDPERREARAPLFLGLFGAVVAALVLLRLLAAEFLCLLLVDFAWNAWHFAAQHAGVVRIYGRRAGLPYSGLEKHGLRLFIVYVILRIPEWSTSWLPASGRSALGGLDLLMLSLPVLMVARALGRAKGRPRPWGKLAYLLSVCGLYCSILLALIAGRPATLTALFLGAAIFHAVEYLAVVTHYARGRAGRGPEGTFRAMARAWAVVLIAFVLLAGTADFLVQRYAFELAVGLNLGAAFLHYTYDALIWKLRRPNTAHALGA